MMKFDVETFHFHKNKVKNFAENQKSKIFTDKLFFSYKDKGSKNL